MGEGGLRTGKWRAAVTWLRSLSDANGTSYIYRGLVAARNVGLVLKRAVRAKGTRQGVQMQGVLWT